jgi:acetylglutamate kinase
MTDVPGVMRDKDDVSTKFASLSIRECKELEDEGIIAGGMIPKVLAELADVRRLLVMMLSDS